MDALNSPSRRIPVPVVLKEPKVADDWRKAIVLLLVNSTVSDDNKTNK